MLRRQVGVREGRENKKQNEPRKLNADSVGAGSGLFLVAALPHGGGDQRQGDDPKGAGEFDGGAYYQCLRSVLRGGADDGAGVVNRQCGPESELRLRKMQRISDRRKNQKRDRIQNKNCAERNGHFLFIGLDDRANGGDGAAAANRRAGGDQERTIAADLQKLGERRARQEREQNPQCGIKESVAARFQDLEEVHAEAERYDGNLQKNPRGGAAGLRVRMREEQAE